jgi:hypothetical protein
MGDDTGQSSKGKGWSQLMPAYFAGISWTIDEFKGIADILAEDERIQRDPFVSILDSRRDIPEPVYAPACLGCGRKPSVDGFFCSPACSRGD